MSGSFNVAGVFWRQVMQMSIDGNIGADRRGDKPTSWGALLWLAVGAMLFLGVNGSRRVWVPYGASPSEYPPTTLWVMAYTAFSSHDDRLVGRTGLSVRQNYTLSVAAGSFLALTYGGTAGLLGYLASWLRQRKGGGA